MYNVIATGSKENAVIYGSNGYIAVDCGVSFAKIKPFLKDLRLVLFSHLHSDHFNSATIKRMAFERPSLRFGCGQFMLDSLLSLNINTNNIDVYDYGKLYDYGIFKISPVKLYHDIEIFGYRLFIDGKKIFHATDTAHLKGITAKDYSIYALEANYDEETVWQHIEEKERRGEFAHQRGAINSHLSIQQAHSFLLNNAGANYEFVQLHQSKQF